MTHTDYTKKLLNIEDENIYFYENCLDITEIKGIKTKIFHAYLTYTPSSCPKCKCISNGTDDIIKWDFKRNCKVKITKVCNYNTILLLDKQRFSVNIVIKPLLLLLILLIFINKFLMTLVLLLFLI